MLNTYGNYIVIHGAGRAEIQRAENEMRQEALSFLREIGQMQRADAVELIVKQYGIKDGPGVPPTATVGWKVGVWQ